MDSEGDEKKNERIKLFSKTFLFEDEAVGEGGEELLFVLRFFICAEASNRDEFAERKQTEQLSHRVPFKNIESEKNFTICIKFH